jgi:hypothetical protein
MLGRLMRVQRRLMLPMRVPVGGCAGADVAAGVVLQAHARRSVILSRIGRRFRLMINPAVGFVTGNAIARD